MKSAFFGILGFLTLAPGAACADEPPLLTLTRVHKAGDVVRYKVDVVAQTGGADATVVREAKLEVKEVKPTGEVTAVLTDLGGHVNAMGQDMDIPPSSPVTIVSDRVGRILKYERSSDDLTLASVMSPEVERLLAMAQDYVLPEKPVKAGDSWQYEVANPAVKDTKATIKATFVGVEKLAEAEVRKIKQVLTAQAEASGAKMVAEIVFLTEPSTGRALKAEGTMKGVPTQYGPMDLTWKATLVKPEPAKPAPPK
jgi:hypothetical protein